MKNTVMYATAVIVALLLSGLALASQITPRLFVEQNLTQFVDVLKDPKYKNGQNQDEQLEKIWRILRATFDFHAVSQLALGRNWRDFTDEEQNKFSGVFADLLGETYLTQIREGYQNEKFEVTGHEEVTKNKAMVNSHILRAAGAVKIDYSLYLSKQGWRVYDVRVEGVSLVRNYRAQFHKILLNSTPADLIERVREQYIKVREKNKAEAAEQKTTKAQAPVNSKTER
jgi:phospholipid transport system substrate-binding protein